MNQRIAAAAPLAAALPLLLAFECSCPPAPRWTAMSYANTAQHVVLAAAVYEESVYFVGGGLGVPGAGARVGRVGPRGYDDLAIDRDQTLWWLWGAPDTPTGPETDLWVVGERGLVMRWNGTAFFEQPSGTQATLFGIWGSAANDIWIVGGTPGLGEGPDDVILHWDGDALTAVPSPTTGVALFKVWGAAADDVWIVGEGGTILHWDGVTWTSAGSAMLTTDRLLTVHGCGAGDVWAVGGQTVLHWDGAAWSRPPEPVLVADANGVSCGPDGAVLIVGNGGLKWRREAVEPGAEDADDDGFRWLDEQFEAPFDTDFHGALVDGAGRHWAVGGSFNAPASAGEREGVVALYYDDGVACR